MAKKTWAYAKNKQDCFILDQHKSSRLRTFYIWEVLKMKKNLPEEYERLTFYSTQANEQYRARMTPVKNGFFKYIENMKGGNNEGGDNETISHSTAMLVLSELEEIKFVIGQNSYQLKFSQFLIEPRLQFENGKVYYPDLIGYFSSECDLAEKWNGKVAIEVVVKHKCEPQKIKDFEEHNIPIIEVSISEKIFFSKEFRNQTYDSEDIEKYYNHLKTIFKNKVYGYIRSNPISVNYHDKKLRLKQEELSNSLSNITELEENHHIEKERILTQYSDIKNKLSNIILDNNHLIELLKEKDELNKELKNKLETIESMSFWQKLKGLFK